jgi:superfamily II DNA or RNA helicase
MDAAVNDFAEGKQRLAVANRVWWKAKNFPQLTVLIRADAQNTDEACIQIVGRLSRKSPETGKTYGLVVDCSDGFDNTTSRNAKTRENKYKKLGWKSWEELQGPKQDLLF